MPGCTAKVNLGDRGQRIVSAACLVRPRKGDSAAREECLIIRIERNSDHTYQVNNVPPDTPLPGFPPEQARQQTAAHFVNRSHSTASRLHHRHRRNAKVQS